MITNCWYSSPLTAMPILGKRLRMTFCRSAGSVDMLPMKVGSWQVVHSLSVFSEMLLPLRSGFAKGSI